MTPYIKPDIHPNRHIEALPSGLTLFLYEIGDYPVVLFDMWIRAGCRDELPPEYGMSHFLEHMVFNGNDIYSKDEYKREIYKIGGQDNLRFVPLREIYSVCACFW